jgi:hypothetical protein
MSTTAVPKMAYTIVEAGALLGLKRAASYKAARTGALPTVEVNGRRLVPRGAFEAKFGRIPDGADTALDER